MFVLRNYLRVILLFALYGQISSSAIQIWELLGHQEKTGHLMYMFLHLVDLYCKNSPIPDCEKVLTLYGTSNLINLDEHTLNTLDPNQRNARDLIWKKITSGAFDLPLDADVSSSQPRLSTENEEDPNRISSDDYDFGFPDYHSVSYDDQPSSDPHPYAVRVPPPPGFTHSAKTSAPNPEMRLSNYEADESHSSVKFQPRISTQNGGETLRNSPIITIVPFQEQPLQNNYRSQNSLYRGQSLTSSGFRGQHRQNTDHTNTEAYSAYSNSDPRTSRNSATSLIRSSRNSYGVEPHLLRILAI